MPELPEVETVRRSLEPRLLGNIVRAVTVSRPDFVRHTPQRSRTVALGRGAAATEILRHGKQMAVVFDNSRVVLIHLGMSGQVFFINPGARAVKNDHLHVRWRLADGSTMCFRDPRRFGGVWAYTDLEELRQARWDALGPDALTISAADLRAGLGTSTRAIKACLLDQAVLAGVGNIYADEALYTAGIAPQTRSCTLTSKQTSAIASAVRTVLRRGIRAGGSTLRDFVDAEYRSGTQQNRFKAYGRAGQPCLRCGCIMVASLIAQRSTTHCPGCQT